MVYIDALDLDLIADFHDIINFVDPFIRYFGYVQETVGAGQYFNECSEQKTFS